MNTSTSSVDWTRRRFVLMSSAAVVAGLMAGCGEDGSGGTTGSPRANLFPVEVTGALGTVRIEKRPERVVTLGYLRDTDIAVAFGVMPVGATKASLYPEKLPPWLIEELGSERPELLDDTATDYEAIAALRPDLILATDSYTLADDYALLSKIAPTLSSRTEVGADTWQDMTLHIAPALGRSEQAADLVATVEQQLTDTRKENREFDGKTFTIAYPYEGVIQTINSTDDASASLLAQLGLRLSPKVTALPTADTSGRAQISPERIDVFDADLTIFTFPGDDQAQFEAGPLFKTMPAVQRSNYLVLDITAAQAIGFPSVLSIPYALANTVPKFKGVLA